MKIKNCPFCNTEPKVNHERCRYGSNIECANDKCFIYGYLGNMNGNYDQWQSQGELDDKTKRTIKMLVSKIESELK